jgi:IS30 family transposase
LYRAIRGAYGPRRGNENPNGLLRQHLSRGTHLVDHGAEDLKRVSATLNSRRLETLG